MSPTVLLKPAPPEPARAGEPPEPGSPQVARAARTDDWPHTTRLLPWLVAAFVGLVWLVPVEVMELPVALPIDSKVDRFALAGLAALWLACLSAEGAFAPRLRFTVVHFWLVAFVIVAVGSIALNVQTLATLGELQLSIKKLALIASYVTFFFIVTSVVRAGEVPGFITLSIALASVAAAGTVIEYRTGVNLFYLVADAATPFEVPAPPRASEFERTAIVGPTTHGLATTTMLTLALPFAMLRMITHSQRSRKLLYAAASTLLVAGAMATLRKTAVILPLSAVLVLIALRPAAIPKLAPLAVVLIILVHGLAPGAMGQIGSLLTGGALTSSDSSQGRLADYDAIAPDVWNHVALGRGYGSYDAAEYRLLDNQYLAFLIEIGAIGTLLYSGLVIAVIFSVRRAARSRDPERYVPAIGAASAAVTFLVSGFLFDVFAFVQTLYIFLLLSGVVIVAHGHRGLARRAQRRPPPQRSLT